MAPRGGFVTAIDALEIGLAGVALGAGRTRADQRVDPGVGIELAVARGDRVEEGARLARIFARSVAGADAVRARVRGAFAIGDEAVAAPPLVLGRIG